MPKEAKGRRLAEFPLQSDSLTQVAVAGTNMRKLRIKSKSDSLHLQVDGDIFASPRSGDAPPLVSAVLADNVSNSRFVLAIGKYAFLFAIINGRGEVEVTAEDADTGAALATKKFDSADGHRARVLEFEVKA